MVSRAVARLRRRHWVPRVEPYTGYGSAGWVRVLARAVLAPPGTRSAQVAERDQPVRSVRGWRSFVSVQVPFQGLQVRIEGRVHQVVADRGGYLDAVVPADLSPGWHEVEIGVDDEWVSSPVVVIGPEPRTALLSDIDDTVMVTALPRPLLAAWNALVLHEHARRAVPGMSEMFARWQAAHGDPPTFYLSTGAWNVAPALEQVPEAQRLPAGAAAAHGLGSDEHGPVPQRTAAQARGASPVDGRAAAADLGARR